MGKIIRTTCTIAPVAVWTVGSVICLMLVMLSQLPTHGDIPGASIGRELYFLEVKASRQTAASHSVVDIVNEIGDKFDKDDWSNRSLSVAFANSSEGFYRIGLWSYCRGSNSLSTHGITYCSSPSRDFWFNPLDVWTLGDRVRTEELAQDLTQGLKTYEKVVVFIKFAFIFATILTSAELLASILAIFTRMGSLTGLVLSIASFVFALAAAACTTVIYGIMIGALNSGLGPYDIEASIGGKMLIVVWLGALLRIFSIPFWLPSIFCCKP